MNYQVFSKKIFKFNAHKIEIPQLNIIWLACIELKLLILCQFCPYFSVLTVSLRLETLNHPPIVGKVYMTMQAGRIIFLRIDVNIILAADGILLFTSLWNCQKIIDVIIMIFNVENKNLHLFVCLCSNCLAFGILH